MNEFDKDLKKWDAQIDEDNTIRFKEPEVLFDTGAKQVKKRFKDILDDFKPLLNLFHQSKEHNLAHQDIQKAYCQILNALQNDQ